MIKSVVRARSRFFVFLRTLLKTNFPDPFLPTVSLNACQSSFVSANGKTTFTSKLRFDSIPDRLHLPRINE